MYETDEDCTSFLRTIEATTDSHPGKYELNMCSKGQGDGKGLEQSNKLQIMAHELGHFVAGILQTPVQTKRLHGVFKARQIGLEPDEVNLLVPAESEAWQIADMILPNASKSEAHDYGMAHYREHDQSSWKSFRRPC